MTNYPYEQPSPEAPLQAKQSQYLNLALLFPSPLRDLKVATIFVNLFLFQFCIHLHIHQDLKLKYCRVMGQKLRYGRPCTRGHGHGLPTTSLHSPARIALLPVLQDSTNKCLMLAQSWKFGVNCCSIGLTHHPAVCTRALVPASDFLTLNRPLQFAQKGQST